MGMRGAVLLAPGGAHRERARTERRRRARPAARRASLHSPMSVKASGTIARKGGTSKPARASAHSAAALPPTSATARASGPADDEGRSRRAPAQSQRSKSGGTVAGQDPEARHRVDPLLRRGIRGAQKHTAASKAGDKPDETDGARRAAARRSPRRRRAGRRRRRPALRTTAASRCAAPSKRRIGLDAGPFVRRAHRSCVRSRARSRSGSSAPGTARVPAGGCPLTGSHSHAVTNRSISGMISMCETR